MPGHCMTNIKAKSKIQLLFHGVNLDIFLTNKCSGENSLEELFERRQQHYTGTQDYERGRVCMSSGSMEAHQGNDDQSRGDLLVYRSEDGRIKLEVRLQDETVWLTQPLMATLFQTTQQNISKHIRNIYEESELFQETTHKENLSVRHEGNRTVQQRPDR